MTLNSKNHDAILPDLIHEFRCKQSEYTFLVKAMNGI